MNFEHEQGTNWSLVIKRIAFPLLHLIFGIALFAILSENIADFSRLYLSELPLVGPLFDSIAPEATPAHIVAGLLAFFIIAVPVYIWAYILEEKIIQNAQEWFSVPQNQILATLAGIVLAFTISIEWLSLFTLIAKAGAPVSAFAPTQQSEFLEFIGQNRSLAIGISATLTIMNLVIALFAAAAFRDDKSQ
ncbi:MAG: hypothetical protein NPIRA05_09640 [Nitrospirales bacterium]|nr:MAG: hypothetical protein NPIRA05_09640 [Nitrospirales bacterium]